MDQDAACNRSSTGPSSFAFAFNDRNFSDRVLRIEVVAAPLGAGSDGDWIPGIAGWAWRHRKRRRGVLARDGGAGQKTIELNEGQEEQIMLSAELDDDTGPSDASDEDPVAMIEEPECTAMHISASEEDAREEVICPWSMESTAILRVKTLHISSAILAAKSPFFYKLFSNGMYESGQRDVTLRISCAEEEPLMEMLQFMYTGRLQASTAMALLDVLMAADKFEVASCMHYCSRLLRNLPMTPESALLYLELPSSVLLTDAVQPLTDAAKGYLASRFKDITRFHEEVMRLPLAGIEAVLSSDDLQVPSEDAVYDFVIKWAKTHYSKIEERKEILGSKLVPLIRFPMMTSRKLKKVLTCSDLEHDLATKLVLEALFYKIESPHRLWQIGSEDNVCRRYTERAYKYHPVKVMEFVSPRQQCLVYLDLNKEECNALYPQGRVYSQAFHLDGQGFFLSAHCNLDQQSSFYCFGLFLGMQEKGSVSFSVEYEFAARTKPSKDFFPRHKRTYKFTGGKAVGYMNLFSMPWASFMAEDSPYFIDNVLSLRAELIIKPE